MSYQGVMYFALHPETQSSPLQQILLDRNLLNGRELMLNAIALLLGYITLSVLHHAQLQGSVAAILIYPISTISYALTEITALLTDYVPDRARPTKLVLGCLSTQILLLAIALWFEFFFI
jgi:hypothetical protein